MRCMKHEDMLKEWADRIGGYDEIDGTILVTVGQVEGTVTWTDGEVFVDDIDGLQVEGFQPSTRNGGMCFKETGLDWLNCVRCMDVDGDTIKMVDVFGNVVKVTG